MSGDRVKAMGSAESPRPPAVSIGVPVHNGAEYIGKALDSILAQTFADFEVIVSDNASTDATETICREYASRDKRFRYVRQESNIGGLPNFRYVLDRAAADYFTWLAHDDVLLPDFIGTTHAFLAANPSVVAVSGDFEALDENGEIITVKALKEIRSDVPWHIRACEFYRYPISNAFFVVYGLMRTDALRIAFSEKRKGPLITGSELPLVARLAVLGQIASIPQVLRVYRYHEASAFHAEQADLTKMPIKGPLLQTCNIWWKRWDQLLVLMRSNFKWRLKLYILASGSVFYLRHYANRLRRFPRWVFRRIAG